MHDKGKPVAGKGRVYGGVRGVRLPREGPLRTMPRRWYCGPKCQRAAWGAHKSACAAAVAAAAAAARGGESAGEDGAGSCGGGGGSAAAVGAPRESDAGGGGSGTGGLSPAILREMAPAVAILGSRKPRSAWRAHAPWHGCVTVL